MSVERNFLSMISQIINHRYFIAYCFIFYLLIRTLLIIFVPVEQGSDSAWYYSRSVSISLGLGYSENGLPTAFWPVGWPAALGLIFWVFEPTALVGQIFNLVLSCITFFLVLQLGRIIFKSENTARLAVLLLSLYPNNIAYVQALMSEIFFTTMLLLGCYLYLLWLAAVTRQQPLHVSSRYTSAAVTRQQPLHVSSRYTSAAVTIIMTGAVFGVVTLTKPQFLLFPAMLLALTIIQKNILKRQIIFGGIILYFTLFFVIAPWSYRNYDIYGQFVFVSTNGGSNLLIGNNPSATGDYKIEDPLFSIVNFSVKDQIAANQRAKNLAIDWIRQNPIDFIKLLPLKALKLWAINGESEWLYQRGYKSYEKNKFIFRSIRVLNQIIYLVAITVGLLIFPIYILKFRSKLTIWSIMGYLVVIYITLISLLFFGSSRFHFPAMPFIFLHCGWVLKNWISSNKNLTQNQLI